jgi:flagellin
MSSLIINHNTQAINTHRNLLNVDKRMKTSLEHLSSGEKIVRAADGPAALMISEQMRAQVASITQAISNSETAVSAVQTTESALNEVNSLLVGIRQLAIHAANEGANDFNMLEADQLEIRNALDSINRISQMAQFGTRKLLDGSRGVNGVAAGKGLSFLRASTATKSSPETGYEVRVSRVATRANLDAGEFPVDEAGMILPGIELTVQEGGKVARYITRQGDDLNVIVNSLQREVNLNGLELQVEPKELVLEGGKPKAVGGWSITHNKYGSENSFTVVSSVPGVLSKQEGVPELVNNGTDVEGTINFQLATGRGNELTAAEGTQADGLTVAYDGPMPEDPNIPVGRVSVTQNSLIFQVGPNAGQKVAVALDKMSAQSLGRNVPNESGFQSLDNVDVRSPQGAEDTMRLVEYSIDGVNRLRAQLGAIQKNALESQLRSLGVAREELTRAESVIRDADMAAELSEFVRNQVISQSSMAMLSQANQAPQNVLSLLRSSG